MPKRHRVLTALCVLLVAACSPALPPVPPLTYDGLAEPVAAQWREAFAAVESSPDDAAANARLAMVLHVYAQFPEADVIYQRARQLDPDNAEWPWYHGLLLRRMGREDDAQAALTEAVRLDPANSDAALQLAIGAEADDALPLLEMVIRQAPTTARAYLALGQYWLDRGEPHRAAEVLRRGLDQAGNFGELHYALATALRAGNAAEAAIEAQLDLHRRHRHARLDTSDELPPALRALDRANPVTVPDERLVHAIDAFTKQRNQRPEDGSVHANLMALHGRLLNFDAAAADYEQAMRYLPADPSLHFAAGNIALLANRNAQALAAFERCLAAAPGFDEARVQLGQANERLGRDAAALEHYRAVLSRLPSHPVAGALLARRLVILGQYDDPVLQNLSIDERAPHGWQWRLRAARLRAAGDLDDAMEAATHGLALSMAAGDHEVSEWLRRDIEALSSVRR